MIGRRQHAVATVLVALLVSSAVARAAPGAVQAAVPRYAANTLTIGVQVGPESLDPVTGYTNESAWVHVNIYDTLLRTANDGASLMPDLATSWTITDGGTVYTFHLRHGVRFHNGQPLTAADVKFCLDRARNPGQRFGWTLAAIKNVAAPNPSTVVVTLQYPWAPFLSDVALNDTGIYPMAYYQKVGLSYMGGHPIGTGPYMFDMWKRGQYVLLKKDPHYWTAIQFPMEYVEFDIILDDATRLRKVEAGALDVDSGPPFAQVAALSRDSAVKLVIDPSTLIEYFNFTSRVRPFNDVNVRQAINHAVNRAALIKTVLHGFGAPANSFIPKGAIDYDAALPVPSYNLSLARSLLSKSTVPHGFTMTIVAGMGSQEYDETARIFRDEMAPLGIKVIVKIIGTQPFTIPRNQPYMYENLWTNDIPDPDEWVGSVASYDPEATVLAHQAERTSDAAARKRLYYQIQQIWARQVWFVGLYYVPFINAVNSRVQGFHENALGYYVLQGVHKS